MPSGVVMALVKVLTSIILSLTYKNQINFESFFVYLSTGIESFSKLGDSIYFQEDGESPALYVTQYISSSLDWKSAGLSLSQKVKPVVSWDPYMRVTFAFSSSKEVNFGRNHMQPFQVDRESLMAPIFLQGMATLNLRIPVWTNSEGAKVSLNGQSLKVPASGDLCILYCQKWFLDSTSRICLTPDSCCSLVCEDENHIGPAF